MSFEYKFDPATRIGGWVDEETARGWAIEARRLLLEMRQQRTLADMAARLREGGQALDKAMAALNLTERWGTGVSTQAAGRFRLSRMELQAPAEAFAAARRLALAAHPDLQAYADGLPLGDHYEQRDGQEFGIRVWDDEEGRGFSVLPSRHDVAQFVVSRPETPTEQKAREIASNPWDFYLARRREIDAENERRAGLWGLEGDEAAAFAIAGDEIAVDLGVEWERAQAARVRAKADEYLNQVSAAAAATGFGLPIAAVAQVLRLLGNVVPWVTAVPPPGPISRMRSGGVTRDRPPTHTVEAPPARARKGVAAPVIAGMRQRSAAELARGPLQSQGMRSEAPPDERAVEPQSTGWSAGTIATVIAVGAAAVLVVAGLELGWFGGALRRNPSPKRKRRAQRARARAR